MRKFQCDYHVVNELVSVYERLGGTVIQLSNGILASGEWILYDATGHLRCYHIYEYAINEWASCQIVQVYYGGWKEFPKKYKKTIEDNNVY